MGCGKEQAIARRILLAIGSAMKRLNGNEPIPSEFQNGVIALGNFDGFHKGHQSVVGRAIKMARERGVPALIATFDPHPVHHFKPDVAPFRLTSLDQRQRLFAEAGADAMLVYHFDGAMAALTAEAFAETHLSPFSGVITGEDFTFGKGRGGNTSVLKSLGEQYGFEAIAVAPVLDGEVISSSRIRTALKAGDCETAARLLTRPFAVEGIVQHGDKNGRKLGFPTANIDMGEYLRPAYGIYAVQGKLPDGRILDGVANLGIRPSFSPPKELLEPYFFDFAEEIYGQCISIDFIGYVRPEEKFDNLEDLKQAMSRDCIIAKDLIRKCGGKMR
jgi:riboflavin kinase / FMN adenylyltransferase